MKLSREKVREVIRLAKERDKEGPYDFEKDPISEVDSNFDWLSPKNRQLHQYIHALSDEEQRELVALMWFGRDDFNTLSDAVTYAKRAPIVHIPSYMRSKAPLAKYLKTGFDKSYWDFPREEPNDPNQMPWWMYDEEGNEFGDLSSF